MFVCVKMSVYILEEDNTMIISSTAKMSTKHQGSLKEAFPMNRYYFFDHMAQADLPILERTEILITYGEDLNENIIKQMPQLKWIQVLSAGLELMPFEILSERNIMVTNAKGIHRIPMAEYTMGMILQLTRKAYELYDKQKEGIWDRSIRTDEVYGKTLGIVGLGAIGDEIAKRAKAFGMNVIGLKRNRGSVPEYIDELVTFEEKDILFQRSDYVVVLLPVTPSTVDFIGEKELGQMKSTAYLLNIARGQIVNEQDLLNALQNNQISGAVIDVFTQEPLPAEHPFWRQKNLILTPHVSGRSPFYMKRALEILHNNLKEFPAYTNMQNKVDLNQGY
jgi:phosphoglycerate dehydrogenase-like enzyme